MNSTENANRIERILGKPLIVIAAVLMLCTVLIIIMIAAYTPPEPDPMTEQFAAAQEKYSLGQYEEALALYEQFIEQYPDNETGYIGLYRSMSALGLQTQAVQLFFSLPDSVSSTDISAIRDDINAHLAASYHLSAAELGFILNETGTYIKTCTGKDYWYYGWCEKTGVLSMLIDDIDSDGITECAAIAIRSHEPDGDIDGTFAFGVQSDAYLLIFESDGSVHEQLIARCFDSRQSFIDVYNVNGRLYVETGSKIDTTATRTFALYTWTGFELSIPVLLSGTGDTTLTLADSLTGEQIFPGSYPNGKDGYLRALSDILEQYGLTVREFGALDQACFTGGTRLCLAAGGITGSPGMKLTGKCDCSLMSSFLGNGHFYSENPPA